MTKTDLLGLLELIAETLGRAFCDYATFKRYCRVALAAPAHCRGPADHKPWSVAFQRATDCFDVPEWFASESDEPWSFLWTCEMLELDHNVVKRQLSILDAYPHREEALFNNAIRPRMARIVRFCDPLVAPDLTHMAADGTTPDPFSTNNGGFDE